MFKKIVFFIAASVLLLPLLAQAQVEDNTEKIRSYDVKIQINQDATFDVEEQIVYDFANTPDRHGIYRDIPIKYGKSFTDPKIKITDIQVVDENSIPYRFSKDVSGGTLDIKIGDPDVIISGVKTYIIKYKVKGAISFYDQFDELYWNAIGHGWDVQIFNPKVVLTLPDKVSQDDVDISCYAGGFGSSDSCERDFDLEQGAYIRTIKFTGPEVLDPYEGMTVAVGWPKNLIAYPSQSEKIIDLIYAYGYLIIPILVFIIMFRLWWRRGRDPKGRGVIVAEFGPPNNFTPAQTSTLLKDYCGLNGISAEIIQLAVLGYLKIKQVEKAKLIGKDFTFVLQKIQKVPANLKPHQEKILEALFKGGDTRELGKKNRDSEFYDALTTVKEDILKSLVKDKYLRKNPTTVKVVYFVIAAVLMFGFIAFTAFIGVVGVLSFVFAGLIVAIFGFFMPAKTQAGAYAKEHILGFKKYLEVAEKDRLEFHNAPEKSPAIFEKFLPFAIALGVEEKWAKQFTGLYTIPPGWYDDGNFSAGFNAVLFANSMKSFTSETSAAYSASAPRSSGSSGGGFSGGGFGGGGGGSW